MEPLKRLLRKISGHVGCLFITPAEKATLDRSDLEELWNIDEIRKHPFDVEVVSSREDKGYRVDEMYFTSEMTPNGPNRIFCIFVRPVKPTKPVPVVLMTPGAGHSRAWYAKAIRILGPDAATRFVYHALSLTKDASQRGEVRTSKDQFFIGALKRLCEETGIPLL